MNTEASLPLHLCIVSTILNRRKSDNSNHTERQSTRSTKVESTQNGPLRFAFLNDYIYMHTLKFLYMRIK